MKMPELPISFTSEDEVKVYYARAICDLLKVPFTARFRTDGLIEKKERNIKILAEFKVGGDLKNDKNLFCRCIIQVLCYTKKIEDSGESLPNIILIANDSHFVIFDSSELNQYLDFVDSSMVPSTLFHSPPPELLDLLLDKINIHKYNISDLSLIETLIKNYEDESVGLKMTITNNNVTRIFENFITSNILITKLDPNQQVALFASIIFNECHKIENTSKIETPLKDKPVVKVNMENYDSFLLSIQSVNKPSSKSEIISQADRLIEEVSRRFHGEFYTPKIWVDEAHRMIEQQFGPNWIDEYVVWDPACGTGNLTRDLVFKELYCSTLNQSDIDIMNQRGYNPEAVKFQYDFLNDDVYPEGVMGIDEYKLQKLAPGLVKALEENRPIIIFMNPPFSFNIGGEGVITKKSNKLVETGISKLLKSKKLGKYSRSLYTQFLYRIILLVNQYKLTNVRLVFYSTPSYIVSRNYMEFRKIFFNMFELNHVDVFRSNHFSGTASFWGVSLSFLSTGKTLTSTFGFHIKDKIRNNIVTNKIYQIYNTDNIISASDWYKEDIIKPTTKINFSFSSGLILKEKSQAKTCDNYIGFYGFNRNTLGATEQFVVVSSIPMTNGFLVSLPFNNSQFYKILSLFSSSRLGKVYGDYYNFYQEFLKPNDNHNDYNKWNVDLISQVLFDRACYDSSIRGLTINSNIYNFENQFFWLPNEMMKQLADDNGFDEMYQDATVFNQDRFVYQELQKVLPQLSPDAKAILDKATELVIKSIPERKRLHQLHPEWHLNAWDAGWYQIKLVLKESMKDDLNEFVKMYKEFENRMREGVYKFGFLK